VLALLCIASTSDRAAASEPTAEAGASEGSPRTGWRRLGYGIAAGWGYGIAPRSRQVGRDVAEVQTITLEPGVRLQLTSPGRDDAWYHGDLEGTLDGLVMIDYAPRLGYGGGVNAGLRYRFRPEARIQPFAHAAVGLGGIDLDLKSQDDGFTFFLQAGLGARFRLDDGLSIATSLRWLHVSNAQTHLPNNGIDTIGLRIGIELW